MAKHDDPLAASRDHIASRDAAPPAAKPADTLPEPRSGAPATLGGIPIASAMLLPADHLDAESAWNQHVPFAFWLVQAHAPSAFVELGTFRGTSYFSFCQAVAALRLPTRCFAIDSWQGDSHTGFYDSSAFTRVNACNELKYAGFSRLVRSSFDEALPHFLDGSIDLLHIDGLHTYEACRHDFESWLPKLSRRAIVLLHDTNVRERGFGVHRLWAELVERYPHFEFLHGHGLGVLGVGAALDAPVRELFAAADDAALTCGVRSTFWRLASAVQTEIDLKVSGNERARLETLLGVTLGVCEIEASRLRLALDEHERQAAELMAQCAAARSEKAELGMALAEARSERAQLHTALAAAHNEQAELGAALAAARSEQAELGAALAAARGETAELGTALAAARGETAELGTALAAARGETAELGVALAAARSETAELGVALAAARSETAELGTALAAARGENAELNNALATARHEGIGQQAALAKKATELAAVRIRAEWAEAVCAATRKELDAHRRSNSWRITQPLRQIAGRSRFGRHASHIVKLLWCTVTFRLGARVRQRRVRRADVKLIAASGLFDRDWYLEQYPDVRAFGIDPLVHYLEYGANEDRDPNPLFDTDWYLQRYPDAAGVNPLADYLRRGAAEGRDPCESFSTKDYLANNPDIAATGMNPLVHYCNNVRKTPPTQADPDRQGRAAVATYLVTNFAVGNRHDARSKARLIVCLCHVFPWLPRAGNEYRIARMLEWLSTRGHDLLVVVAPSEEDDLAEKRRAELFAKYDNAMVCYRDGRILASIKTLGLSFTTLDRRPVAQVFDEVKRRAASRADSFHAMEQHYCHEALIGILCETARQESKAIYYINYAFMTRFLRHMPRKTISFVDTHDILSRKTAQVRNYGITDVMVTSDEEERMLRRAGALIAIHNNDAKALRTLVPGKAVISVGVDFSATDLGPPSRGSQYPSRRASQSDECQGYQRFSSICLASRQENYS